MSIAAVFLDLGGTLIREVPSRAEIYAEEARRAGLAVSSAELAASMARAHAVLPRELDGSFRYSDAWFRAFQWRIFVAERALAPDAFEPLSARLFARFEAASTFQVRPGARELLLALRGVGLSLGLISNWGARLPRLLRALELDSAFDFVLGSAAERLEKPERAFFERAVARAGLPAELCLHAGDHPENDARGALGAGLQAVLVDHEGRFGSAERALCPVVASLPALQDLILERRA
jgi:putative hydrolase of the HAD superfamily